VKVKNTLSIIIFIFLFSCASVPAKDHPEAGDIVANFPEMTIGDSWETTDYDYSNKYGSETYNYEITNVEADNSFDLQISVKKSGKTHFRYYDSKEKSFPGILSFEIDNSVLSFPMFVGKSWNSRQYAKSRSGEMGNFSSTYLVQSYESVETEAGTFYAFKIKRKTHNIKDGWHGECFFWYSPEVKGIIKSKHNDKRGIKLIKFNLKK
jgi:hypothetical protein